MSKNETSGIWEGIFKKILDNILKSLGLTSKNTQQNSNQKGVN
ncbi:MAG TPA: hypothetical protein PKC30_15510 [Saprospiraceae bacterium]|nr:hypothetical protein [Saprospiraceae bacterium]